jgi:hypothetical protein
VTLQKRGRYRYGDGPDDVREEIRRYSKLAEYPAAHFADCACVCTGRRFRLSLDDTQGAAVRQCVACNTEHAIGDSADFLAGATLEEAECPCGTQAFEITVGVSLYVDSEAVRWLYLGCRCSKCGLVAVYGDWKNESDDFRVLLTQV